MKHILLSIMGAMMALPTLAVDFEYTYEGEKLIYTVISETAKTCEIKAGATGAPSQNVTGYSVVIPLIAKNGTKEYSVIGIGAFAFMKMTGSFATNTYLNTVVVPETVTSIGQAAFYGENITVICEPKTPPTFPGGSNDLFKYGGIFVVNENVVDAYKASNLGKKAKTVVGIKFPTQSIQWNQNLSYITVGDDITLTATATSGLNVAYTSSDTNIAEITGNKVTFKAPGDVTITASQAGNNIYYNAEPITMSVTVKKAPQSIEWDQNPSYISVGDEVTLAATATSGLEVTYESSDTDIAEIDGDKVTFKSAGDVTITASQVGDDTYESAEPVLMTVTVKKSQQSIEWNQNLSYISVGEEVTLIATATSG
ncbi:MAG: hypothetical protein K2K47_07590, partial [Duncaniella sp.]|nr:hypothetical protein [Duncaniella sp.]